jgi:hypothetical protein
MPNSILRSMMKAPGSDSAIQVALAGVMCHRARQRLISRQLLRLARSRPHLPDELERWRLEALAGS